MDVPESVLSRASVLHLPKERAAEALAPVLLALCDCTKGGEGLEVDAKVLPETGEVRATTNDPAVAQCVSSKLDPGRFEPFDIGRSDCVDCAPHALPAPSRPDKIAEFAKSAPHEPPKASDKSGKPIDKKVRSWLTFEFAYDRPARE